jgi:hypothetical protein
MNDDFINFASELGCEIRSVILIDKSVYDSEANTNNDLYESLCLEQTEFKTKSLLSEGIILKIDPDKFKDWN